MTKAPWFGAHTHSMYSTLDGMTAVPRLVEQAHHYGYPALALTDHGSMAGAVQLYKECKQYDMKPGVGFEGYLIDPNFDGSLEESGKAGRFHFGLIALDLQGYQALVRFMSMTHTRPRFNRFPRCTLNDLATLGKDHGSHVAFTTGCYFGLIQQTVVREDDFKAERLILMLAKWFPNLYVEVQNHNIVHDQDEEESALDDDAMVHLLAGIARKNGLPLIATQDNHYCTTDEKAAHSLMKRMVYGSVEDAFPGDSFHLASADWVADHYTDKVWSECLDGSEDLLNKLDLKIPPLDKFTISVPEISSDPDSVLKKKCIRELRAYLKRQGWESRMADYMARLKEELSVIADLGMGNYFLLMLEDIEWCRSKKYAVEARGSASGSLVNFLIRVTQVDPLIWDTRFERFLSRDRTKPPDIDMDIEDVARPHLLRMIGGKRNVLQIGTFGALGARELDQKGSVMATYQQYLRRRCVEEAWEAEQKRAERRGEKPAKGKAEATGRARYAREFGHLDTLDDVKREMPDDYIGLKQIADMGSVRKSYGVHASGILLSTDDFDLNDWIPRMLVASSNTPVTQFDGDDVEKFGLLKGDWLGQKTLTIMKTCQELMERDDPTDFSWIPNDDPAACKYLRDGRTDTGIFHFEGYTKAKGGKELGTKNTYDCMLVQALYMPGAMNSGQKDLYVARRKSAQARREITYIHPIYEEVLKETHGAVVFQEQPLDILRKLGMDIESVNAMFRVIKDSGKGAVERNKVRLEELHEQFDRLALAAGIKKRDLWEAWFLVTGFMNYGFNRAHAAAYGIRSYRCAYLKANHPLEFMTALLQCWAGDKKEVLYMREARRIGIKVLPPSVNISGATWAIDYNLDAIRRGLVSIAGIGDAAAEEIAAHAPYDNITQIVERCDTRKVTGGKTWLSSQELIGTLKKLDDSGALDDIAMA